MMRRRRPVGERSFVGDLDTADMTPGIHGKLWSDMTTDPLSPGLREELITTALQARLKAIDAKRVEQRALDVAESRAFVIRQAEALVAEWLRTTSDPDPATLTNQLAKSLGADLLTRYELLTPAELLTGILPVSDGLTVPVLPDRPQVPLTANELLVNDRKQPSIGSQLKAELQSATRVDLICAFIVWSGVVTMLDELRGVVGSWWGGPGDHHDLHGRHRSQGGPGPE